ncbi:hypothetical protein MRB53_005890 [Persea americana]|uniref:Uncharacterized protein n=1 Tax=Persea americana TaxID=3435 RepID=A0ACC2MED6_PERAE|nr:hypothetical protein MRB53_005890 [Persea americana]
MESLCLEAVFSREKGFLKSTRAIIHLVRPPPIGTHKSELLNRRNKPHEESSSLNPNVSQPFSSTPFFCENTNSSPAFSAIRPSDAFAIDRSTLPGFSLSFATFPTFSQMIARWCPETNSSTIEELGTTLSPASKIGYFQWSTLSMYEFSTFLCSDSSVANRRIGFHKDDGNKCCMNSLLVAPPWVFHIWSLNSFQVVGIFKNDGWQTYS